jgi:hypothetical protein
VFCVVVFIKCMLRTVNFYTALNYLQEYETFLNDYFPRVILVCNIYKFDLLSLLSKFNFSRK